MSNLDPLQILGEANDEIARLPHPRRVIAIDDKTEAFFGEKLDLVRLFGQKTFDKLVDILAQPLSTGEVWQAMTPYPEMQMFFSGLVEHGNATGTSRGSGAFFEKVLEMRFRHCGGRLFQTRDSLEERLNETDLDPRLPMYFVRIPFSSVFIQFGESLGSPLRVHHQQSGAHILEGVYVHQVVRPKERILEFAFFGSPVGKADATDDAFSTMEVVIPEKLEDAPLGDLLSKMKRSKEEGLVPEWVSDSDRAGLNHLAKVLLYLNSDRAVTEERNEFSRLSAKISGLGAKKRAKMERKLNRTYDCIIVGAATPLAAKTESETNRSVSMHWRRGHFRNQAHGEGRKERKLIWIEPIVVAAEPGKEPPAKQYRIK